MYMATMHENRRIFIPVLKKMFDLHNIEEARHILFTKSLLTSYSAKAGYIKRTLYSYVILRQYPFRADHVREKGNI